MTARKVGYVLSSLIVGITLFACTGSSGEPVAGENNKETPSPSLEGFVGTKNLCVKQAANTFHCVDDTRFELCTGGDNFVVNSCPKGLCATRHPASKNPCVGADCVFRPTWARVPLRLGQPFQSTWARDRSAATSGWSG